MRALAGVVIAVVVLLVSAVPATADDASLRAAGQSRDSKIKKLSPRYDRAVRTWSRSDFKRTAPLIRVLRRLRGEFKLVARRIRREQPSTSGGAEYKRIELLALRDGVKGFELQGKAVRVARQGRRRRARGLARSAERFLRRADRREKAAIKAIEASQSQPSQPSPSSRP